ncbi:MAG: hypothetical protein A2V98_21265 [Planctomycetes bacterium RBG_16_64_12]|nr:MAG: hypothetical protein A2V98_21265 [Planctomycetes bacterium RBG_16_64_12]
MGEIYDDMDADGDGTFTDVSDESGVGQHAGSGMGMVAADYDKDGDTDVFVLNDVAGNFFFKNDGSGNFEEVGWLGRRDHVDRIEVRWIGGRADVLEGVVPDRLLTIPQGSTQTTSKKAANGS